MEYIKGLVSVVIPTYKRSDMLMRAINSVLEQSYKSIELIVVNDNVIGDQYSKDLYRLVQKINDPRFVFLEQTKHINGAAARNVGIGAARGEYIAFQDDDDYWDINKIERQVELLSRLDNTWGAVACLKRIYSNGNLVEVTLPYHSGLLGLDILEGRISLGTGAVLIRRSALDDSGYFDESLSRHQDLQLFARLASKYKVKLDPVYMQNRETKDTQNRPSAQKLVGVKQDFYKSVADLILSYPRPVQKRIYALHNFEVAYIFLKERDYKNAFVYMKDVFMSPVTLYIAAERSIGRIISGKFKRYLAHKYANNI